LSLVRRGVIISASRASIPEKSKKSDEQDIFLTEKLAPLFCADRPFQESLQQRYYCVFLDTAILFLDTEFLDTEGRGVHLQDRYVLTVRIAFRDSEHDPRAREGQCNSSPRMDILKVMRARLAVRDFELSIDISSRCTFGGYCAVKA
jgi:hypothetical protein